VAKKKAKPPRESAGGTWFLWGGVAGATCLLLGAGIYFLANKDRGGNAAGGGAGFPNPLQLLTRPAKVDPANWRTDLNALVENIGPEPSLTRQQIRNGHHFSERDLYGAIVGGETVTYRTTIRGYKELTGPQLEPGTTFQNNVAIVVVVPVGKHAQWAALPVGSEVTYRGVAITRDPSLVRMENGIARPIRQVIIEVQEIVEPQPPAPDPARVAAAAIINSGRTVIGNNHAPDQVDRVSAWHLFLGKAEGPAANSPCHPGMMAAWTSESTEATDLRLAGALMVVDSIQQESRESFQRAFIDIIAQQKAFKLSLVQAILKSASNELALPIFEELMKGDRQLAMTSATLADKWNDEGRLLHGEPSEMDEARWQQLQRQIDLLRDEVRTKLRDGSAEEIRAALAEILRHRRVSTGLRKLQEYQTDEDERVRQGASAALTLMLEDPGVQQDLNRRGAKEELLELLSSRMTSTDREAVFAMLGRATWIDQDEKAPLEAMKDLVLGENPEDAARAAHVIARWGGDRSDADYHKSTQNKPWLMYLQECQKTPHAEARTVLEEFIAQKDWSPVRKEILSEAGYIVGLANRDKKKPDLKELLSLLGEEGLKRAAVEALQQASLEAARFEALAGKSHAPVHVLLVLGEPETVALPILREMLESLGPDQAAGAIYGLQFCGPEGLSLLVDWTSSTNEQARAIAEMSLASSPPDFSVPFLARFLPECELERIGPFLIAMLPLKQDALPLRPALREVFRQAGQLEDAQSREAIQKSVQRIVEGIEIHALYCDPDFWHDEEEKSKARDKRKNLEKSKEGKRTLERWRKIEETWKSKLKSAE
jgi:hypothetical protein